MPVLVFFFKRLHDKVFPLGFALVALGFILISISSNVAFLFVSVIVLGFGFGIGVPYMYNWLDWAAPEGSINLGTTVVLVLVNIGCFISPTVINLIEGFLLAALRLEQLCISAVAFVIIFAYALIHY